MSHIRFHPVDEDDANLRASHVIEMSENVNAPLSVPPSSSSPSPSPSAASSATATATATDEIGAIPQAVTTSMASTATHPDAGVPPAVQAQAQVPHAESTRDLFSAKATTMAISAFKTPKNTILILVKAGLAKAQLELWQIFILGVMAGIYVAIGTLTMTIITGGLSAEQKFTTSSVTHSRDPVTNVTTITSTSEIETRWFLPSGFQRLIQAAVFPLALIPVILAGAELFTSNVMFGLAARYGGKTTTRQMLRHWGCSYLGNFTGSVLFAFLLVYLTQLSHTEPIRAWILNSANYKTHQGWGTMVLKGIGCNILVCLAVWQALVAEDVAGKILGIWWPLFGFIAIGFEHSIANMFTVPLALMEGLDVNFGDFLAWNLIPVTLGNVLGGGFFITVQWLVFREHLQVQLEKTVTRPGFKIPHDAAAIWAALTKRWNMAHSHAHPHITTPAQAQAQLVGHNMYNYNQPPIVTSHVGHKQE